MLTPKFLCRRKTVISLLAIAAAMISCEGPHLSSVARAATAGFHAPKLVWISLDAFNHANLQPFVKRFKNPHPRGLKWIMDQSHSNNRLNVGYPSITAPSHISTITCSTAGQHGVFLNSGNWNGERDLNGFAMPLKAQTWIQALRRSGKTVAVAAYPSVDGSTSERSADMGVAYDAPTGRVQYTSLNQDGEGSATVVSRLVQGTSYNFNFKLSHGTITATSDFGDAVDLPVGVAVDVFGYDGLESTRRKASVSLMNLGVQGAERTHVVAVSPVSMTPVTGEELKTILDAKDVVWSNLRDYGYAKYENGVALTLETVRHRRDIEIKAIQEMIALGSSDAMFWYFEDIDVLLHAWIGVAEVEQQLAEYLEDFDQKLGDLIASLPAETNLVVLGDHGMSAIKYELNARKLLPTGVAPHTQLRTSGGAMYLYPKGALDSTPPAELDLEAVAQALRDANVEFDLNRKVFRRVVVRGSEEAKRLGISSNLGPWIMAFADDGIAVQDRQDQPLLLSRRSTFVIPEELRAKYPDPMNSGSLIQPSALGSHGHDSDLESMRTQLVFVGPELNGVDLSKVASSIQVVPAVAQALGWAKPAACQ